MEPENNTKGRGSLVGLVIIIIILVVGGIYIWQSGVKNVEQQNQIDSVTTEDSTDLNALNQDLQNADLNVDVNIDSLN